MKNIPLTARKSAFTLLELLVVIGIIGVLISILIPTATVVKIKAQTVNTRAFLSRLESAIQVYASEQSALPGPVPNGSLRPYSPTFPIAAPPAAGGGVIVQYKNLAGAESNLGPITSSENLYLGLSAGLKWTLAGGAFTKVYFDEKSAESPDGPNSMSPTKPHRYTPYINIDKSETTYTNVNPAETNTVYPGWWCDANNGNLFTGDSRIPEYVDKFSSPMPILYMRASKGAPGIPGVGATVAQFLDSTTPALPATYNQTFQYDPEMIQKTYTNYKPWINKATGSAMPVVPFRPWPDIISSPKENDTAGTGQPYVRDFPAVGTSAPYKLLAGDESYFGNPVTSTALSKQPGKKDEYILISAGPDGRYGTADDITNFR